MGSEKIIIIIVCIVIIFILVNNLPKNNSTSPPPLPSNASLEKLQGLFTEDAINTYCKHEVCTHVNGKTECKDYIDDTCLVPYWLMQSVEACYDSRCSKTDSLGEYVECKNFCNKINNFRNDVM